MKSFFNLSGRAKFLVGLVVATLVICYGPWSWLEELGTIGWLFKSQIVLGVVVPIIACITLVTSGKNDK